MKLFDFQVKALDYVDKFTNCALYCDMGLGKTFMGSEKLMSINSNNNLVVCQKSKIKDWLNHFLLYYKIEVFDLTSKQGLASFLDCETKRLGVINYDLLFRRRDLFDISDVAVIFDESSVLKNDKAKRTKAAFKLKTCANILLSGTPVGGKYEELWTQCRLLGWDISRNEFWDRYVNYREWYPMGSIYPIKIVVDYKNVEDLKENLRNHGAYFLKSDEALSLPEQSFIFIDVPETKQAASFRKNKVVEIDGVKLLGDTPLNKLRISRQLAGVHNPNKIKALSDILESTNDRVIVFYNFWDELHAIEKLTDRPKSYINGEMKDLTAYEEQDNSVTFIQYTAGALGLNLQKARIIVYFTPPLSSELFEQSKKRIHRLGQKSNCCYYLLRCGQTEAHIYDTLDKRQNYTVSLFE